MFDSGAFEQAKFQPRTKTVPVPTLEAFFKDGEPEWVVRGLTATELHRAIDAGNKQKTIGKVLESIADNSAGVEDAKKALGISGKDTPGDIAKRLEMLVMGSVEPVITLPVAVKLAENRPVEFYVLTNEITELTGLGAENAKPVAASKKMTA